jgi:hypothetical protein
LKSPYFYGIFYIADKGKPLPQSAADAPNSVACAEKRGRKTAGLRPPGKLSGGYGGWVAEGGRGSLRRTFIGGRFTRNPNIFVGIFC